MDQPYYLERVRALQQQPATARTAAQHDLAGDREAEEARRAEWTAAAPGRLGRRLIADIDRYLEFFAIARAT
jgi:hypothetical protein